MDKYNVTGMSCAACSARVEKAVSAVPGVTECAVSLLTNSMGVSGTASTEDIIKAVEDAGYGASLQDGSAGDKSAPIASKGAVTGRSAEELEISALARRLILSVAFLLILMYFSMGVAMWNFPAPKVFDNPVFLALFEMILSAVILAINSAFFTSGFKSLFKGGPNMNTLVALGSSVAYLYSLAELFIMVDAQGRMDHETVHSFSMNLYFESAAMIPTLITVGKLLEAISKGRTTDALKGLIKLTPVTATVLRDGAETSIPAEEVQIGDIFVVRPGEAIPVDGELLEGSTAVNEAALTGESVPADKEPGDRVFAATINGTGFVKCKATAVGRDTTLSKIIELMSDAAATKAPLARIADKVSGVFVPAVMGIALLTFLVWLIVGKDMGFSVARAITVLVISCPCALGLATPVAIMVSNGVGAKNGILYKTASALEALGRTEIVVLDKTGTITTGHPEVTDILPENGYTEKELLTAAASLEAASEHPLAAAVMEHAQKEGITPGSVADFEAVPGKGVKGKINGEQTLTFGGNPKYIKSLVSLTDDHLKQIKDLALAGKTPLLFANKKGPMGIIAVRDSMKEDSLKAIHELKGMGIEVCMLTGDNEHTAKAIAHRAGIGHVIAGVLPTQKKEVIDSLKQKGRTAMVGDGINDAPALAAADTGIAIGAGADIAIDAADIVVVKSRLTDVSAAIRLSRATIRNIHENLFWAFFYNIICIPLAAGVYGFAMKPMYGALAMSLSSFCVCMNALRLNLFKLYDPSRDKAIRSVKALPDTDNDKITHNEKEKISMKKNLKIEGMMCEHCEARVKKTLLAIDGVEEALVSHKEGCAEVTLTKDVSDETLKSAVEAQDYKVTEIK